MSLFGPKYKPIVGLDIGTATIRAMELRPSGNQWRLHRWHQALLPPTLLSDGKLKASDEASQFVRNFHKEGKFSTNRIALSVGGPSVICKKIFVDQMTEMELEDQIALEAEEYIPFDIDEVYIDFQIIGDFDDKMAVLLTACKKDFVNDKLEICRQAGLLPLILDLDVFSLANAYVEFDQTPKGKSKKKVFSWKALFSGRKNKPPSEATKTGLVTSSSMPVSKPDAVKSSTDPIIAIVNIGSQNLNTIVLVGGNADYTREVAFGCRSMVNDVMDQTGLTLDEVQNTLHLSPDQADSPQIQEAWQTIILPFEEKLAQQIRQSLDMFQSSRVQRDQVQAVQLTGGGAAIAGIDQRIGQNLGLPVTIFNPSRLLKRTLNAKGPSIDLTTNYTISLGLALRGMSP
ncbi:MAG: pilus assembly protein PilM [Magnetococcales bacterium]|nr:pilus assembly protein PilM [Magnetococcales bacterium]